MRTYELELLYSVHVRYSFVRCCKAIVTLKDACASVVREAFHYLIDALVRGRARLEKVRPQVFAYTVALNTASC